MAGFVKYKSYSFVDKDPIIDAFRTLRGKSKTSYSDVQAEGGPTAGTVRNWEHGKVKRPHFASVWAAGRICGAIGIGSDGKGNPHFITRANGRKP
jgi:hypothetical protein